MNEKNCTHCKRPNSTNLCGRCHVAAYCSKECQVSDWKSSHKNQCGKSKEDLTFQEHKQKSSSADYVHMMTSFLKMNMSKTSNPNPQQLMIKKMIDFYDQTPDLQQEFIDFVNTKKLNDIPLNDAINLLNEVTVLNKSTFMKEILFYKTMDSGSTVNPLLENDDETLFKLLNSTDKKKIEWFFKAKSNDVYKCNDIRGYESDLYHSFSNARARTERFDTGKLHVAIGFVDLSLILWMDLNQSSDEPFNFVGFEKSAFSVAKTLVISSMLRVKDDGAVDAILQVWYSSCWSDITLRLFYLVLPSVIKACTDQSVLEILNHWSQSKPPSIKVARHEWLQKVDESLFGPVINILDKRARATLMEYFLTGQLLPASYGSIVMFELPKKMQSNRSRNESCFHSLDIHRLAASTKKNNGDFVLAAISLIRGGIGRLHDLVLENKVHITIHPPVVVSIDSPKVIEEIRSLNPYTMSWNNCLDYMSVKDFHRLARACSAPEDTIHFGYSMNWKCDVFGSSCLTYPVGEHMKMIMKTSRDGIKLSYHLTGLHDLLISPPIDNPINVMDSGIQLGAYRNWTKVFFDSVPNVAQIEPSLYNVFSRTNSCLFFTWTYDESINFNKIQKW